MEREMKFKKGDTIICVDTGGFAYLKVGKIYNVIEIKVCCGHQNLLINEKSDYGTSTMCSECGGDLGDYFRHASFFKHKTT